MAHNSTAYQTSHNKNLTRELAILTSALVTLLFMATRPFGFRTFLHALGHNNVFSLLLVASAVGIVLVMMQSLRIIFPDIK
ncbi:MAG: hypothetical protein WCF03_15945 [Nitrososphaeraceae archaeon]